MVIQIKVRNRIATYVPGEATPVCGNDSDVIHFDFDEEWANRDQKTARFLWGGHYHDEEFTGDTCPVPVFLNTAGVSVGVKAGDGEGGDMLSTTTAAIPYALSVRCGTATIGSAEAEKYTNEAKEAASAAQTAADTAQAAADTAQAAAGTAQTVSAELESQVTAKLIAYNYRLGIVENALGLDSPFQILEDYLSEVEIPADSAQYAKVVYLGACSISNTWYDGYYTQGVKAIEVCDAEGAVLRRYDVPFRSLPDYAVGYEPMEVGGKYYSLANQNYIAFEDGKAYYHHNVYHARADEMYGEPTYRDEGDSSICSCGYTAIVKKGAPEVIDISDQMEFDGMLDVSGSALIRFVQIEPEDGEINTTGCLSGWNPSPVKLILEHA